MSKSGKRKYGEMYPPVQQSQDNKTAYMQKMQRIVLASVAEKLVERIVWRSSGSGLPYYVGSVFLGLFLYLICLFLFS
jgi:hypothetical protein